MELNEALAIAPTVHPGAVTVSSDLVGRLGDVGFVEGSVREAVVPTRFLDVGAVVFHLRAVPWQAPGFDVVRHRAQLERLHHEILRTGGFVVRSRRFLVAARKPVGG